MTGYTGMATSWNCSNAQEKDPILQVSTTQK